VKPIALKVAVTLTAIRIKGPQLDRRLRIIRQFYRRIVLQNQDVIYILTTQPSESRLSHRYPIGSIEHIIMKGHAKVGLSAEPMILNDGDYIC